jgi:hypothetical protein
MGTTKKFVAQNPELLLQDGIAMYLAINAQDEIATRQLLREYETSYPVGYGKQVAVKTLGLLSLAQKEWLRKLY